MKNKQHRSQPRVVDHWQQNSLKQIDQTLADSLHFQIPYGARVIDAMRHSLLAPGKRIRPMLFLSIIAKQSNRIKNFVPFACALEAIHCYSLIHDDLPAMDDDDFRRGQPTNHKVFGEATAILAGDALLTLGVQLASKKLPIAASRQLQMIHCLSQKIGVVGLIGGQQADLDAVANSCLQPNTALMNQPPIKNANLLELQWIQTHKTAALFQACLLTAALACKCVPQQIEQLKNFGLYFGQFFQIKNDFQQILGKEKTDTKPNQHPDIKATEKKFHQAKMSDIKNQKKTFATLYSVKEIAPKLQEKKQAAMNALEPFSTDYPYFYHYGRSLLQTPLL